MAPIVLFGKFEWDAEKASENINKYDLDFYTASLVFLDPNRIVAIDEKHSFTEERLFCLGKIGNQIATVRFTKRGDRIRIIGAGFWRAGRKLYETQNRNHKEDNEGR